MPNDFFELPGNAVGFLDYPILWEEFAAFVRKAGDPDSIEFLEAYDNRLDPQKMYMNFVAEGAPRQINIPGPQRTAVRDLVQDGQTHAYKDIFDDCRSTILGVIEGDFGTRFRNDPKNYPRFLKAEFGGEVLAALAPDQARALSEDQLTDLLAAALPALTTPKPDDATSDAEKRSYDKKLSVMWNALSKIDVPPAFDPTSFVNVAAASMTAEATKERKLRRAIGVPDDASDLYNEYRSLEKAGPAADPTAETQRTQRMNTVAAILNGKTNNEGAGKLYALTQIEESLAVAKAAKDRADALEQARRPGAPITEAEIAPQRELEAAEVRARGFAEGAGMSPEMAENFFTAFTDGNEDYADSLNPPSRILHRDDAQKQAYGEQYSADVQLMPAEERSEFNLKKILRDPSIERIKQQWLVADANTRPGLKDQAIALAKQIGLTMIPPRPIYPAEIEAFFQGEISTDEPTPAETPDAAAPTGGLAAVLADTSMVSIKKDWIKAKPDDKARLLADAVNMAKDLNTQYNFGHVATAQEIETFFAQGDAQQDQADTAATDTATTDPRKAALEIIFADKEMLDYQDFGIDETDDKWADLLKEALERAVYLSNDQELGYLPTEADLLTFLRGNPIQPTQAAPEAQPTRADVLAAIFADSSLMGWKQDWEKAADDRKPGLVKDALAGAIALGNAKNFTYVPTQADVQEFFATGAAPQPDATEDAAQPEQDFPEMPPTSLADLLGSPQMAKRAADFATLTDQGAKKAALKEAIAALEFEVAQWDLNIKIAPKTVLDVLTAVPPSPTKLADLLAKAEMRDLAAQYQATNDADEREAIFKKAIDSLQFDIDIDGLEINIDHDQVRAFLRGNVTAGEVNENTPPPPPSGNGGTGDGAQATPPTDGSSNDVPPPMPPRPETPPQTGTDAGGAEKTLQDLFNDPSIQALAQTFPDKSEQDQQKQVLKQTIEALNTLVRDQALQITVPPKDVVIFLEKTRKDKALKSVEGLYKDALEEMANLIGNGEMAEAKEYASNLARVTANDPTAMNGADAAGILEMAQEVYDRRPKTGEGSGPVISPKVKEVLSLIAEQLREKNVEGARETAVSLANLVRGTISPLAGKTADDILKMIMVKQRQDDKAKAEASGQPEELHPNPPKLASTDAPTADAPEEEENFGPIKLGVLKTFKWARFKMLYKVKIDKKAESEFDVRIVEFSKMLIKKQKNPKVMFKQGTELMGWIAENKGSMFFSDNKHLIAGLLIAFTEFQDEGAISTKLTKSDAKIVLGGAELVA